MYAPDHSRILGHDSTTILQRLEVLSAGNECVFLGLTTFEAPLIILAEVVIAVMLRSFKSSLSDKDIYWNVGTVSYATVGKVDTKGTMPLKLEVIRI